jgi:hypothetical protein
MGIDLESTPESFRRRLEGYRPPPTPKRSLLEREEQRVFAAWLKLNALPHCWHATHKRSSATTGVFDFWVGKDGRSAWIEFKSPSGRLSEDQQEFRARLAAHEIEWHVVLNADQAIKIVKAW